MSLSKKKQMSRLEKTFRSEHSADRYTGHSAEASTVLFRLLFAYPSVNMTTLRDSIELQLNSHFPL